MNIVLYLPKKLRAEFPELNFESIHILGGHQFLEIYKNFCSVSLCAITDKIGSKKIGSGIYATPLEVNNKNILF